MRRRAQSPRGTPPRRAADQAWRSPDMKQHDIQSLLIDIPDLFVMRNNLSPIYQETRMIQMVYATFVQEDFFRNNLQMSGAPLDQDVRACSFVVSRVS